MSTLDYFSIKNATEYLLKLNLQPSLEAFRYYYPNLVSEEWQYAQIEKTVSFLTQNYLQEQRKVVKLLPFPKTVEYQPFLSRKRPVDQISIPHGYQPHWFYRTGVDNSYSNVSSSAAHPRLNYQYHWQPQSQFSQLVCNTTNKSIAQGQYQTNTNTNYVTPFSSTMAFSSLHKNTSNTDPSIIAGIAKTVHTPNVRPPISSDTRNKTVSSSSKEYKKSPSPNHKKQGETNVTSEQHNGIAITATSSSNFNLENEASNPRESLNDCSVELCKSTTDVVGEVEPQKPVRFTKANDESGYLEVKKIIRRMLDEGVKKPAKKFRKEYPALQCKYESVSLSVGIACFVRDYKASKVTAAMKKAKANNSSDSKTPNESSARQNVTTSTANSSSSLELRNVVAQTCNEQNIMADTNHGTTVNSMQHTDAITVIADSNRDSLEPETNTSGNLSAQINSNTIKGKLEDIIYLDETDDESLQTNERHSNIGYIDIDATNHSQQKSEETSLADAKSPFHETQSNTTFDTHVLAVSLAEWFFVEVVKVNIANFRPKCKEYADELIKHGFYDKEMILNFCTIDLIDSDDFKFMLLAHRQCLKKWLLEHRVSK